ncbi:MAG TPA: OmpW family outer membrane protein [Thermoanaerobaculia bacterium]|nr:OmpW family outer membrane protein [Thermoanaerobaculia bacterium]
MKRFLAALALTLVASPLLAQQALEVIVDGEGVRRTAKDATFAPGRTRFVPTFATGGGVGVGLNLWLSDRVSLEAKAAGIGSHLTVRSAGSDFVVNADLGYAQIYPITAVVQWHPMEHGTFRPYLGIGAAHIILRNIERRSDLNVRFDDPTGLVVDGGFRMHLSDKWSVIADARYVAIETRTKATFIGTSAVTELHVRPLIVGIGVGYRF